MRCGLAGGRMLWCLILRMRNGSRALLLLGTRICRCLTLRRGLVLRWSLALRRGLLVLSGSLALGRGLLVLSRGLALRCGLLARRLLDLRRGLPVCWLVLAGRGAPRFSGSRGIRCVGAAGFIDRLRLRRGDSGAHCNRGGRPDVVVSRKWAACHRHCRMAIVC